MKRLFQYNWMVREEWYKWCEDVSEEELLKERIGGLGNILHTLFHIIEVEWSWIRLLQGDPECEESFDQYRSLARVRQLDARFRLEVENFVNNWNDSLETELLLEALDDGSVVTNQWGEVMRHIIVHEIHHIGQLSIWARELGKQPVSANFIERGLVS